VNSLATFNRDYFALLTTPDLPPPTFLPTLPRPLVESQRDSRCSRGKAPPL
jgi:hypothetical protein